jgi:hypothetical protein
MDKKPLIGISILAVVLLILGSLSNVVGYQSVQTSQQNLTKERINQRELLFQTIVDIANNRDIQRILLKSQMLNGKLPDSDGKLPKTMTIQQLKQMYVIGLILSKSIRASRIQSIIQQYKLNNPELPKEISAVIEINPTLRKEMTQLRSTECDCEKEHTAEWGFPAICFVLMILFYSLYIVLFTIDIIIGVPPTVLNLVLALSYIPWFIGYTLGCRFAGFGPGTL